MTKVTLSVIRKAKLPKGTGLGGGKLVEAFIHVDATGNTVHAKDLHLRKLSRLFLQPLSHAHTIVAASITTTKNLGGYASIVYYNWATVAGTLVRHTGTIGNFYVLAIGE